MADVKQILVVDDHFEMLELLRSMLEVSGHEFEVLAVPSAEEGMLELLRTNFDLVITDVRLPGMSGFDFVRRIRRRHSDMPVIMITAYSSPQGQTEANELGVYRYFRKPLDTDGMLTAVRTALYGESIPTPEPEPMLTVDFTVPDIVRKRLDLLRADTGASGLVLATTQGQLLLELGEQRRLEIPKLIVTIAQNIRNSFALAEQLGETSHFTLQYHAGQSVELYNANIGQDFFISLFYSAGARRGRIGTIWVFAQRAIKELVELLPSLRDTQVAAKPQPVKPEPLPVRSEEKKGRSTPPPRQVEETPKVEPEPVFTMPERFVATPQVEPAEVDMDGLLAALNLDETAVTTDIDSFWDEALKQDEESVLTNTLSFDEAASMLDGLPMFEEKATETAAEPVEETADVSGLLDILNLQDEPESVDLDAFWDIATDEESIGEGLSFEEARQRGLISTEIDANDPEQ
ncbi:MAG: response regulator [Ardenticatenaceae bacterium]|nr:response regulator [Ardenticatenaceae bacterium]